MSVAPPRRGWLAAGVAAGTAGVALSVYLWLPRQVPAGQPPLRSLPSGEIAPVREEFNAAADRTRLLLLLSPT